MPIQIKPIYYFSVNILDTIINYSAIIPIADIINYILKRFLIPE